MANAGLIPIVVCDAFTLDFWKQVYTKLSADPEVALSSGEGVRCVLRRRGATPSPTSWVGTCRHPADGRDYIVSYRDCCGKASCGRCLCANTVGEMPLYRPQLDSDLIWCFGAPTMVYHCSTAEIVGVK